MELVQRQFMEEQGVSLYRLFVGVYGASLYWMDTAELNDADRFAVCYRSLSAGRQRKVDSYLRMKDKKLSLAAGLLLDCGLSAYGLRERETEMACGENGKPYLPAYPRIHLNLSYSENMAFAVFAETEVGCDIEKVQEADMELAERFLHPAEYACLARQEKGAPRDEAFCRLRTLKESFVKALGVGVMLPFPFFEVRILSDDRAEVCQKVDRAVYSFREYRLGRYCASVCFRERECFSVNA